MYFRIDLEEIERGEPGFTLVELLLAIFIFSVVISTVYGSYRATFHVVNTTEKKMETAAKAQVVLERIVDDLSSLVQGERGFLAGEQYENSNMRGDSLAFVSAVHIGLTKGDDLGGHSIIQYSTETDGDTGLLNLYRSDSSLLPGIEESDLEARKYLLCDGLKEFRFSYFDGGGGESEEWRSGEEGSEGGKENFPVMITVVLQFADSSESEQFSIFTTSVALPPIDR